MQTNQDPPIPVLASTDTTRPAQVVETDGADEQEQGGLDFGPLLRTVRRKAWLIIGITVVCAAGAYLRSTGTADQYESGFRLLVEPLSPEATLSEPSAVTRGQRGFDPQGEFDYDTQLVILESNAILSDVIERVKAQYPTFSGVELNEGLTIQRCCTVASGPTTALRETKMIEAGYQGEDPEQVLFVSQVLADRFLEYSLEERKTRIGEGVRFIDEQLPELEQRVTTLQNQIQSLQQQYFVNDPMAEGNQISDQIRLITTEKLTVQQQLEEQQQLNDSLRQQLGLSVDEAVAASALSEDTVYADLRAQLQQVENQIAIESVRFSDASPTIRALQQQRDNLSQLLSRRAEEVIGENIPGGAGNATSLPLQNSVRLGITQQLIDSVNQIQVLEARNQALDRSQGFWTQQAQRFPAVARQYNELQRQLALAVQTLDQLLTQRETLKVEAAQTEIPWELVSSPGLQYDENGDPVPVEDELAKIIGLGVLAGLVLGTLLAVLLERQRDVFYTPADVKSATSLPFVGLVPYSEYDAGGAAATTAGGNGLRSQFQQAVQSLYTKINFLSPSQAIRSFAVSAVEKGDGGSTLALSLAKTAAMSGKRVLLVDANLEAPRLHRVLGVANTSGLGDLLNGDSPANVNQMIQETQVENLYALTAGNAAQKEPEKLASPAMRQLINTLQNQFDLIIYDTPNLSEFTEATFVSSHTDGVVLVTSLEETKRAQFSKVIEDLKSFRLRCLGIVANDVHGVVTA
ncbi:MAG: polysaccharide biosynthesis tyrosine autokinase [Cyanobacteria bacterium P01_A01_bin.135]